jgi:KUP system potassium uptake protein
MSESATQSATANLVTDSHQLSATPQSLLMLAALGVVYGDIGTSPLYALKESFNPAHGVVLDRASILGVLSMLVWTLTLVVTVKYVFIILRANHHGEGGVLALQALARSALGMSVTATAPHNSINRTQRALMALVAGAGLLGATMFYGDALITPSISVLSAMEGLEVATPVLKAYVIPFTITILVGLFCVQRFGTGKVGGMFGPVTLLWFAVLDGLGVYHIAQTPDVLNALNPQWAARYGMANPGISLAVLGSVFLAVTGAEALYADMGHFGIRAVRNAWLYVAMPGLMLNYFGQGALLMSYPAALENPLFNMVPSAMVIPLVILAAAATVIASQATISGAYSLTAQAISLGYLPRMKIVQTSGSARGQIYMPVINWLMLIGVLVLVVGFGSSSNLSAAYGISISVTMLCTTVLFSVVAWRFWKWPTPLVLTMAVVMLAVDAVFVVSNTAKILHGGWVPVVLAIVLMLIMSAWSSALRQRNRDAQNHALKLPGFLSALMTNPPHRVRGTAVFLTAHADQVPHALLHNLKHNQVLHERVLVVQVVPSETPRVPLENRLTVSDLGSGVWSIQIHFGFMERLDVYEALGLLAYREGMDLRNMTTTYFMSRSNPSHRKVKGMHKIPASIVSVMQRLANRAADFFQLPDNRIVEFGRSPN